MEQENRKRTAGVRWALVAAVLLTHATLAGADDAGDAGTVEIEADTPSASAPADGSWTPFQASLWPPYQIFDESRSVRGLRISFPYGRQARVSGLDFGLFNQVTEEVRGVQLGAANMSDGTASGVQLGLTNSADKGLRGGQLGFINRADEGSARGVQLGFGNSVASATGLQLGVVNLNYGECRGAQLGLFNSATTLRGFQLGLFNGTSSLRGLQLGLLNRAVNDGLLGYMPLVNFGF
jgi:hypothetical protein